jgi:hypothetical protein
VEDPRTPGIRTRYVPIPENLSVGIHLDRPRLVRLFYITLIVAFMKESARIAYNAAGELYDSLAKEAEDLAWKKIRLTVSTVDPQT